MTAASLLSCPEPLAARYDVALLDLDGVVYIGPDAVPGAPRALERARGAGMRLAFVTNNAARAPAAVADHLRSLGVPVETSEVVTSAQAAAHHLAERLPPHSRVLVVGTTGLLEALTERGLVPVSSADDDPAALVQGYSPDLDWHMLAEAAVAIRRGVPWVATNLDATVPSTRGPLPGNGSMVAALRHATGRTPVSVGKPAPAMHREAVERSGAKRPLVTGDRLDTDIEGANAAGCHSLLVLTGVTAPAALLAASPRCRPSYVAADLQACSTHTLLRPSRLTRSAAGGGESVGTTIASRWPARAAPIRRRVPAEMLRPIATSETVARRLDALRALCVAGWRAGLTRCQPADDAAESALGQLGIA